MKVLRTESRWHNSYTLYQSHNKVHKLSHDIDMLIFFIKRQWFFFLHFLDRERWYSQQIFHLSQIQNVYDTYFWRLYVLYQVLPEVTAPVALTLSSSRIHGNASWATTGVSATAWAVNDWWWQVPRQISPKPHSSNNVKGHETDEMYENS